jgi:hypothetical protein
MDARVPLTSEETAEWVEFGKNLAEPVVIDFDPTPPEDLKAFVLDYVGGTIFTDHHLRGHDRNMMGSVFMPVAFGAFSIGGPEEGEEPSEAWLQQKKLPICGDEPKRPDPPSEPGPPVYPDEPPAPKLLVEDAGVVATLAAKEATPTTPLTTVKDIFDTDTGEGSAKVQEYREGIRLKNEWTTHEHNEALAAWEAAKVEQDQAHQLLLEEHQAAFAAWETTTAEHPARHREWKRQKAITEAANQGFTATRLRNLGCLYEHLSQAGPRSINGYPIFWSVRILNRDDWQRAAAAIDRELERRDNMEI